MKVFSLKAELSVPSPTNHRAGPYCRQRDHDHQAPQAVLHRHRFVTVGSGTVPSMRTARAKVSPGPEESPFVLPTYKTYQNHPSCRSLVGLSWMLCSTHFCLS